MSATPMTMPGTDLPWELPSRGRVGMFSLIAAEAAIFIIFVVAYLFYAGKSLTGPMPKDVLRIPVFYTVCLLSSSLTIHFAIRAVRQGSTSSLPQLVVRDGCAGSRFSLRHGARMVPADFRRGVDHPYQPVRNNILFIGRLARLPCDCRSDLTLHGFGIHVIGTCRTGAHVPPGRVVSLLAFRGRGVGRRLHRGLRHRAIGEDSNMSLELPPKRQDEAPNTVEMPSPTAWPIVLAFGITLVFAGMLTTASVSILGAILALSGYVGWFRDVLPHEKHESVPVLEEPQHVFTSRPIGRPGKLDHARSAPGTASP